MNDGATSESPIEIGPIEELPTDPQLLFKIFAGDVGNSQERVASVEYRDRRPVCVAWDQSFPPRWLDLTISNIGDIASDLVKVDYQLVYCVAKNHGLAEGFVQNHAGEVSGSTSDDYEMISFVQGRDNLTLRIDFGAPSDFIVNLYFRARLSTIWTTPLPKADWDFASDWRVVEATKRFR